MNNFITKQFPYIKENQQAFIKTSQLAHKRFLFNFAQVNKTLSSTFFYRYYNIFALTVGCSFYYKLFYDVQKTIRAFSNTNKPLWFQSWLNFHKKDEVLNWHSHADVLFHWYISIDPKNTITEFEDYEIKNEIGLMYIGPGYKKHRVKVLEDFKDERITIAFDVMSEEVYKKNKLKYGEIDINTGFIPVLIWLIISINNMITFS